MHVIVTYMHVIVTYMHVIVTYMHVIFTYMRFFPFQTNLRTSLYTSVIDLVTVQ